MINHSYTEIKFEFDVNNKAAYIFRIISGVVSCKFFYLQLRKVIIYTYNKINSLKASFKFLWEENKYYAS